MELVPDDIVDAACAIHRRFADRFISAWEAGDGLRVGVLVCEVAATAIHEERRRAAGAGVKAA